MLGVAVSPYHLSTRETVAMAALLIADRVATILPSPLPLSRAAVRQAIHRHPAYLRMLESWRWSSPLWRAGVIVAAVDGDNAAGEAAQAAARIQDGGAWGPLRAVVEPTAMRQDAEFLERFSADVLKGGPDPSFALPVTSGLDAFSTRHGLMAARTGPAAGVSPGVAASGSVSQRAEALIGTTVCAVALPVLLRAAGHTIVRARAEFEPELAELRAALSAALDSESGGVHGRVDPSAARRAAAEYARAFEASRDEFIGRDDERGERVTAGYVSLTVRRLPHEASLRSALAALRTVSRVGRTVEAPPPGPEVTAMVVSELSLVPSR